MKVEPNTELTYYLNVTYDGVDKNGIESSDTTTAEVKSGYIEVEDKIPEGLTFVRFVASSNNSIGAVKKSDGTPCSGYVVDDSTHYGNGCDNNECYYFGLHYNKSDRTVRFKIRDLEAGCVLNVGIVTKTPSIDDPSTEEVETRRDFYNTASSKEGMLTVFSNTVHAYMEEVETQVYNVKYEYEGDIPNNAPELPEDSSYSQNSIVGVFSPVNIEGYDFSGWHTDDVNVENDRFIMPEKDVIFKGNFQEKNKYKVKYIIDDFIPDGYVVPLEKEYYEGQVVNLDSIKEGDIFGGYKFLGWTSNDMELTNDTDFIMGNKDITITGKFEIIKYKVEYKFIEDILPEDSDDYLPDIKEYAPGEIVKLEKINSPEGYKFLGWNRENNFSMPSEDVIIYGQWKKIYGYFEPKIDIEIINKKDLYVEGDTVEYKISVTNNEEFDIKDIIVVENNKNVKFIKKDNYDVETDNIVTIPIIKAGETVYLYSRYVVLENDKGIINNEVELKSARSDNMYDLVEKEYKASIDFKVGSKDNPKTLDESNKFFIGFILSIVGIIIGLIVRRNNGGSYEGNIE